MVWSILLSLLALSCLRWFLSHIAIVITEQNLSLPLLTNVWLYLWHCINSNVLMMILYNFLFLKSHSKKGLGAHFFPLSLCYTESVTVELRLEVRVSDPPLMLFPLPSPWFWCRILLSTKSLLCYKEGYGLDKFFKIASETFFKKALFFKLSAQFYRGYMKQDLYLC